MKVIQWFQHHGETYLQNEQLGSSLTENEQLLQEHQELERKAKVCGYTPEQHLIHIISLARSSIEIQYFKYFLDQDTQVK